MNKKIYSHGKLLLTGEYLVLDGAKSLAIPTSYGQTLKFEHFSQPNLYWKSLDPSGKCWFEAVFVVDPGSVRIAKTTDETVANTLCAILNEARKMNPEFLKDRVGLEITTQLSFPRNWGLGSSSTLINNIAQWARVNAYHLLWNSFSGSGYDIACAQNPAPITYQLKNKKPLVNTIDFNPPFAERLFFIHLNKKQNSREGISHYRSGNFDKEKAVESISTLTDNIIHTNTLEDFEMLIERHEEIIANIIRLPKVKDALFPDYFGSIKSLGAWGGDFILATGNEETPSYFKEKGFTTVIPFNDMIYRP